MWPAENNTYIPNWEQPTFPAVDIPPDAKRFLFVLGDRIVYQTDDKDECLNLMAHACGFDRVIDRNRPVNRYVQVRKGECPHSSVARPETFITVREDYTLRFPDGWVMHDGHQKPENVYELVHGRHSWYFPTIADAFVFMAPLGLVGVATLKNRNTNEVISCPIPAKP